MLQLNKNINNNNKKKKQPRIMILISDKVGLRPKPGPIHNDKDTVMNIYASNSEASITTK